MTMKKYSIYSLLLAVALVMGCEQELADLTPPADPATPTGTLGTIDATKFVTIGNSLVAGFQSNALFTEGQNESVGKIINQQFTYAGGTSAFNQPDINSVNGFSGVTSTGTPLGRLILFDPDGATDPDGCLVSRTATPFASGTPARSVTCPRAIETPAVPAPYNVGDFPAPFTGDKAALNNFGVPGILLGQALTPFTGGPSTGNAAYNALYARFASNPGVSTILGDAIAAQPTFYLIELGNNDILGFATTGGSGLIPLTSSTSFSAQLSGTTATVGFNGLITSLLLARPDAKGVIANIPDVTAIPFFFTVPWNTIEFKETDCDVTATLSSLNGATGFGGYNAALDAIVAGAIPGVTLSAEDAAKRKVFYTIGKNGALITDKTLPDLTAALNAINPALAVYGQARQTTSEDRITLPAGAWLGTCVNGQSTVINGVSFPLTNFTVTSSGFNFATLKGDDLVLLSSEVTTIKNRTMEFNSAIAAAVEGSGGRLALADVNGAFNEFVANRGAIVNGISLTPSISPPNAAFSEDGVHPNGRGYAFLANIFIDAINEEFGATIPKADITKYRGTRTPVSPDKSF
jgi:hypothetical protein